MLRFVRILTLETRFECIKNLRNPGFMISILVFPVLFYLVFGLAFDFMDEPGIQQSAIYAVMCSGFGAIGVGLFGFSIQVANERAQGLILLKQVSPMPSIAYFLGKAATAAIFSFLVTILVCSLAIVVGDVEFGVGAILLLGTALAIGCLPFCALGFALGYWLTPTSVHGVANLIFLPLVFFSGLAFPLHFMPDYIASFALALPSFHLAELILGLSGYRDLSGVTAHLLTLLAYTMVFLLIGLFLYRREEFNSVRG